MFAKLESLEQKFHDLENELASPEVYGDQERYTQLARQHAELQEVMTFFQEYKQIEASLVENRQLEDDADPEMRELVKAEIEELEARKSALEKDLQLALVPKDPLDGKNIILEIRAGTGGDEAALFAMDLFRMYSRFAESKGWKVEILSSNETGGGGFKEVIALISGSKVYSFLKFESGAHRVQRVPATESQGRIHTSAVTVAILPEAEEVDIHIDPADLRIDVFRSSGPGGQSVNTTDSAVRITYIPTGLVVTCQDEKSQHKNKAKALKVLSSRLLQEQQALQQQEHAANRRAQVGSGDRSERIRTYNFPQSRVTDHRINLTLYNLDAVMQGDLDEILTALVQHYHTEALKDSGQAY